MYQDATNGFSLAEYMEWCAEQRIPELSAREFNRRTAAKFGIPNRDFRSRRGESRERIWPGLRLKENPDSPSYARASPSASASRR
jgi:hypothetical protein